MGLAVVTGAVLTCSFGMAPGNLCAGQSACLAGGKPMAVMTDVAAYQNITPFGMCTSLANPQVAAATAAALGVLTPQPCTPTAAGTWMPAKPMVIAGGKPCIDNSAKLICACGAGVISIQSPGQATTVV